MTLFNAADQFSLNFVHKRILGAAKGFVTSGFNPISAVGGFLAETSRPARRTLPRTQLGRGPSAFNEATVDRGRAAKLGGPTFSRTLTAGGP